VAVVFPDDMPNAHDRRPPEHKAQALIVTTGSSNITNLTIDIEQILMILFKQYFLFI
jgi:hypothetical protein